MNRRNFIGSSLGLVLSTWLARSAHAEEAEPRAPKGKAKAVILLWMNGGPSHLDTWDPKQGKVAGPGKSIKTNVPGISISEHLPLVAGMANKLAIVRGLTSKEGNHQRAQYLMRTGYAPNPTVTHPTLAAWTSKRMGEPTSGLPASVSLGGPSLGAGFFGVQHGPFVVSAPGAIPQNSSNGPFTDDARFEARKELLGSMEASFADKTGDAKVDGRRIVYEKADKLMHAAALKSFDVSEESASTQKAFGDTPFGKGCLTAVRLVEKGVKFVEVTLDGWDTHQNNFDRTAKLMSILDPAMSSLLKELAARHLLDTTTVMWAGDFGRTPNINGNEGRDHHPQAMSAVLAGAGIKGGQTYGETDATGDKVAKDAVPVPNLMATLATVLGLSPDDTAVSPAGRPISLTDKGSPLKPLLA